MVTKFSIIPGDDFIWNHRDLVNFLIAHQNQSILLTTSSEGCCARSIGLYDLLDQFQFKDVTIETSNPFERHDQYRIILKCWHFLQVDHAVDPCYHYWTGEKIFGCIYGRPLWHRLGLASHLIHHYADKSVVGMMAFANTEDQRKLFEIQKLWMADPLSVRKFLNITDDLPIQINQISEYTPGQQDTDGYVSQTKYVYPTFLIDIVAETFTTGRCFFVTEKTLRPMLLKKPFILMGSKHSLQYLKQMGFKTFSNFWNEEYDSYGENNRYHKIIDLIDAIGKKSQDELLSMYSAMQDVLSHITIIY